VLDLPEPHDSFDEKLVHDIREYGWHWIQVADEHHPEHADQVAALRQDPVYEAAFIYSAGLWLTWGHPELILVGRWDQARGVLGAAVSLIEEGARFEPGEVSDEIVEGYPASFREVSADRRTELLTYAAWANRDQPFEALQLVLPDSAGVWPWEEGYSSHPQPLIS